MKGSARDIGSGVCSHQIHAFSVLMACYSAFISNRENQLATRGSSATKQEISFTAMPLQYQSTKLNGLDKFSNMSHVLSQLLESVQVSNSGYL